MIRPRAALVAAASVLLALLSIPTAASAVSGTNVRVSVGSPQAPFSANKQNEPALAVDPAHPNVLVAGANDNIDMEACNAGDPTTCPFTPGVGVSGVYISQNAGRSWTQPTYTGLSARTCQGPAACTPQTGPIGTLPRYQETGLVSDGDPAVTFGPKRGADGVFRWSNGSRLYYANLTSNLGTTRSEQSFRGSEAIAVSRTDDVAAAAAGSNSAWQAPVLVSKQSAATFSDKEQVWADNAATSPHFGTVYVCWASFRGQTKGQGTSTPLIVARSVDGGSTWTSKQVGAAASNAQQTQPDGCTLRTDSHGKLYVFGVASRSGQTYEAMYTSTDGGVSFAGPSSVAPVVEPGVIDPNLGRPVMDGLAGARTDLAGAPSVDIANGAPSGAGATNQIAMTFVDGRSGLNREQLQLTTSRNGGATWSPPTSVQQAGDRPVYTAPAFSPDGTDLWLVYNAFTTPYRNDTTSPRGLVGVVRHADVTAGTIGAFSTIDRGAVGDPRSSSQNDLQAGFLGDYVYAVATNDYGAGVWNDSRNGVDCPAVDAYRASLYTANPTAPPAPQQQCAPGFGETDIYGGSYPDPTP